MQASVAAAASTLIASELIRVIDSLLRKFFEGVSRGPNEKPVRRACLLGSATMRRPVPRLLMHAEPRGGVPPVGATRQQGAGHGVALSKGRAHRLSPSRPSRENDGAGRFPVARVRRGCDR